MKMKRREILTDWALAGWALAWVVALGAPVGAQPCPEGSDARSRPSRPGNDDVIVLLDSSLSMGPPSFGPWARGYMAPTRQVLLRLVDCYLKPGDFVLVATFDSEARIEIAKEIARSPRDRDTLREQIRALGPSRPRYWERRPDGSRGAERLRDEAGRRIAGGSLRTDLGAALAFGHRALRDYASPEHRQLVLLFTDGEHDPPELSPYREGELRLDELFPRDAVPSHRLGIVALPREDGGVDPNLTALLDAWDPDQQARTRGELALIELEAGAPLHRQVKDLARRIDDLLSIGIDLVHPERLDLGSQVRPHVDERLVVANRSLAPRTIEIAAAVFRTGPEEGTSRREVGLEVAPRRIEIPPGGEAELRLTGDLGELPTGAYDGRVELELGTAASFRPSRLPVEGVHLSWLTAYGPWLAATVLLAAAVGFAVLLYRRRPIWIAMVWRDGDRRERAVPQRLSTGGSLRFGGRGHGALTVDGPARRIGTVRRTGSDRYAIEWEAPTGPVGSDGEVSTTELVTGRHEPVPDAADETVVFFLDHHREALERTLDTLCPRRNARERPGEETTFDSTRF